MDSKKKHADIDRDRVTEGDTDRDSQIGLEHCGLLSRYAGRAFKHA